MQNPTGGLKTLYNPTSNRPDNSSSTFTSSMLCFGEDGEGGDSVSGLRVWSYAFALEHAYDSRVEI